MLGCTVGDTAPLNMTALDDAERLLVSASFGAASAAAAGSWLTHPHRTPAECIWIQAEFKLGRLSTPEADARRLAGAAAAAAGGGGAAHPRSTPGCDAGVPAFTAQSLVLWCKLRLAIGWGPADMSTRIARHVIGRTPLNSRTEGSNASR